MILINNLFKRLIVHIRITFKFAILIVVSLFIILGIVAFVYKPTYSVTLNGEDVGYINNKKDFQTRINEYLDTGEEKNVAFVQVDNLPEYKMCLLKRNIVTNDEEIFEKIKQTGKVYYKYYAIMENGEERDYVASLAEAEEIIVKLREQGSLNIEEISYVEKHDTDMESVVSSEQVISKLYKTKSNSTKIAKKDSVSDTTNNNIDFSKISVEKVSTKRELSKTKKEIGIALAKPVSGTISSRFGSVASIRGGAHTGLDIASPRGTAIKASAAGVVSFAGWKGSYGKMVAISHGNGVQTYYAHCSSINVKVGQKISQGQVIASVGSTGNSTGPHLHLEVRINGVAQNPQNYVY